MLILSRFQKHRRRAPPLKKTFDILANLPISRSGDRAPRFAIQTAAVLVRQGQRRCEGLAVNISRSGVLVRLSALDGARLAIGDEVELTIAPDRRLLTEPLTCRAKLTRIVAAGDTAEPATDFGFKFLD